MLSSILPLSSFPATSTPNGHAHTSLSLHGFNVKSLLLTGPAVPLYFKHRTLTRLQVLQDLICCRAIPWCTVLLRSLCFFLICCSVYLTIPREKRLLADARDRTSWNGNHWNVSRCGHISKFNSELRETLSLEISRAVTDFDAVWSHQSASCHFSVASVLMSDLKVIISDQMKCFHFRSESFHFKSNRVFSFQICNSRQAHQAPFQSQTNKSPYRRTAIDMVNLVFHVNIQPLISDEPILHINAPRLLEGHREKIWSTNHLKMYRKRFWGTPATQGHRLKWASNTTVLRTHLQVYRKQYRSVPVGTWQIVWRWRRVFHISEPRRHLQAFRKQYR